MAENYVPEARIRGKVNIVFFSRNVLSDMVLPVCTKLLEIFSLFYAFVLFCLLQCGYNYKYSLIGSVMTLVHLRASEVF